MCIFSGITVVIVNYVGVLELRETIINFLNQLGNVKCLQELICYLPSEDSACTASLNGQSYR